ncbi:MAG: GNAT family N-acetyltransferase [Octadecabacter sp.]|jgi:RimJ/RimL family protein N-acetyltransferase|tara:strand:+ start:8294 stop:8860 length:567 start_codon:yes stop_codon:yes gene_type:complete
MTVTVTIPTLETERLILRAPQFSDANAYVAFKTSERAKFTGGPIPREMAESHFLHLSAYWMLRGYGLFIAALKTQPDHAIGGFGVFHPQRHAEPEFGWTLYDAIHEGKGYVTEAMRKVIPMMWDRLGTNTAQSHIDEGNAPSVAVARALGATFDAKQTQIANAPGGEFYDEDDRTVVNIWRHHKGAMT